MSIGDWLLAAALLTGQPSYDAVDPVEIQRQFTTLRLPMISLAIEWEILDPRETRHILARPEDFWNDIHELRRRRAELADAPPLADAQRFPDRAIVNELLVFNRAYRKYLEERQPLDSVHAAELRQVQQEVDDLYQIWDAVRDARCDYYYVKVRRQALKRLRELLSPESYQRAELPPHVPTWRFQRVP
ncbi:MAG TPA: hypothetical protein PKD86_15550 [Gemmatales bacterium]|nr:hypothetical protein [Gemmatales bacterium]HMP60760.1 hypothetical protein [Gemmatales bacterium]